MNQRFRTPVFAAMAAAVLLFLAGCQTQLYGDLSEGEANAIQAVLATGSIRAEKRPGAEGTYAVFVEEADFSRAVELLEAHALPRRRYDDLGKVFGKEAMFSTPAEEKARYLYAMQEELSHTISAIDGVLAARVHLVFSERDQLGQTLQEPSAAVFIRHVDDDRHDPIRHRLEIGRLIAASVPNLNEDRIVVSFFPVKPLPPARPAPAWKTVLGLRVAPESFERAWWMFAGAGAACLFLAAFACACLLRKTKK